jgi:hypothetical protein
MEFARFDSGDVLRKETGGKGPKLLRLVVGNPLTMKEMAKLVPDAASYVPLTILVDERADGVHLSYDLIESFLAPYGHEAALQVGRDLDAKLEESSSNWSTKVSGTPELRLGVKSSNTSSAFTIANGGTRR